MRASRVLLVGEDPHSAATIVEMLRAVWPEGLLITQAPCISDAVQELSDHTESCVLLTLPSGEDPLLPLRELAAAAPAAPILVLSDHAEPSLGVAAVQAGAQDHLSGSELHPALLARCVRYAIERKRAEVRLTRRALEDPLTGLPNRLLFRDRVSVALDRSQRTGLAPAVMFLDLDAFKEINDTLGHTAGDRVLRELAERFTALLRPMDTVARIGGDEFTFLFEGLTGEREAVAIAQRITEAAAEPIVLGGPGGPSDPSGPDDQVSIAVSIGITMLDDPAVSLDEALRAADGAMYRAKRLGGGRAEVSGAEPGSERDEWTALAAIAPDDGLDNQVTARPELGEITIRAAGPALLTADAETRARPRPGVAARRPGPGPLLALGRLARPPEPGPPEPGPPEPEPEQPEPEQPEPEQDTIAELREALDHGQLRVHYQPRVTISGETGLSGFEALVRWHHPRRGLLGPAEFIALAEQSGLIAGIGDWVIERALEQIGRWRTARPDVSVSVNVSARQLEDPDFPRRVAWAIERSGADPGVLWLEVAAATVLDGRIDDHVLAALGELGVHIAIDDVGLGSAALGDLQTAGIDMLKIDRRFVRGLGSHADSTAVVGAFVALGHTLGMDVVAAGVETDHQLVQLRDLGCDGAQGFLFSQPVPEQSVGELLGLSRPRRGG